MIEPWLAWLKDRMEFGRVAWGERASALDPTGSRT